jgi:GntR family transcriptional regulator
LVDWRINNIKPFKLQTATMDYLIKMNDKKFKNKLSKSGPSYQPLYKQVEEYMTQLLIDQRWKPGEILPNEFKLAEEFNVSQGTVRKALNGLTASKILQRKQGIGTFVCEHAEQNALYRFFPLVADGEKPELPTSETLFQKIVPASLEVAENLELKINEEVIFISRRRMIDDEVCILEDIYLPEKYFKGFMEEHEIPHTLYHFYQTEYQHTVQDISDKIKAVSANKSDAKELQIKINEPLLLFTRVARTLNGKLIEYRITRCRSDKYHYLVNSS